MKVSIDIGQLLVTNARNSNPWQGPRSSIVETNRY